jgi:hypothetical protein
VRPDNRATGYDAVIVIEKWGERIAHVIVPRIVTKAAPCMETLGVCSSRSKRRGVPSQRAATITGARSMQGRRGKIGRGGKSRLPSMQRTIHGQRDQRRNNETPVARTH